LVPALSYVFKAFHMKHPVVLRSNCSAQHRSWQSITWPSAKKGNQGCSDLLWIHWVSSSPRWGCMIEKKRLQLISVQWDGPPAGAPNPGCPENQLGSLTPASPEE
jgi:hypothetical protein